MPGLDPGIHLLEQNLYVMDGLHRNSGLPELRIIYAPQVG